MIRRCCLMKLTMKDVFLLFVGLLLEELSSLFLEDAHRCRTAVPNDLQHRMLVAPSCKLVLDVQQRQFHTMLTYFPPHFTDAKYHRRCGVHVQTLLLYHGPVTILVAVAAISIGIALLTYPNLHHKSSLYKQLFRHYARVKANNYVMFYRIVVGLWIGMHIIHIVTVATTVLATQLIRPELLYPQIIVLIVSVGFYTFTLLSIITMNFIGSSIIWITALIASFFGFFTITNLYLIVLTHRYVADRREALQRILSNTKTVTFKENRSITVRQAEQRN